MKSPFSNFNIQLKDLRVAWVILSKCLNLMGIQESKKIQWNYFETYQELSKVLLTLLGNILTTF